MENKMKNNSIEYVLSGDYYIPDLNDQAQNRLQMIIGQMQEAESVTEELKENDQMAWIRAMSSIHNRAEEIVLKEIVYRSYSAGLHFL